MSAGNQTLRLILDAYLVGVCDGALGAEAARSPEEMAAIRARLLDAIKRALRREESRILRYGVIIDEARAAAGDSHG